MASTPKSPEKPQPFNFTYEDRKIRVKDHYGFGMFSFTKEQAIAGLKQYQEALAAMMKDQP